MLILADAEDYGPFSVTSVVPSIAPRYFLSISLFPKDLPPLPFSFQILIRNNEKLIIDDHGKWLKEIAIGQQ
jgi:hypothetical protein